MIMSFSWARNSFQLYNNIIVQVYKSFAEVFRVKHELIAYKYSAQRQQYGLLYLKAITLGITISVVGIRSYITWLLILYQCSREVPLELQSNIPSASAINMC